MGPSEDRSTGEKNQAGHRRIAGKRRRVRRPRRRACLLKGCERRFRPLHPRRRYCSEECREEARRWREWKARHHYRNPKAANKSGGRKAGDTGCARNEPEQPSKGLVERARVIARKIFCRSCDRPGCYEEFQWSRRSPLQRFCSHSCRRALERVLERERRWRERQQEQQWRSQHAIAADTPAAKSG